MSLPKWVACLSISCLVSGCGFLTLRKDIERADAYAGVEGKTEVRGSDGSPIVVVAYSDAAARVIDLFVTPHPSPFFFALPAGTYRFAAFEDRNRDLSYQPDDEPAVLADPNEISVAAGARHGGIDLVIDPNNRSARLPFAVNASTEKREITQFPAPQLGTIVKMGDARFSEENAKLGLWDPVKFLIDVGAGLYFLEEYDPNKIPVLFVHGAMGHPGNWTYLVSQLDRSRFQPWLVYYPTAPHLGRIGQMLVRTLAALQVKYQFSRMILVAHSMGGLVTRGALNFAMQNVGPNRAVHIPAFVSISSPWGGHAAAAEGVEYAPVVAPSWEDMAPGSAFLTSLPRTVLPPECAYTLLFSFGGNGGKANDGTVTVSSELSMPIQRQAVQVMGFNETHTGILRNADVAAHLNAILTHASQSN